MLKGQYGFEDVLPIYCNPKSLKATQLFGLLDKNTNSYTSGVIAEIFFKCIKEAENPQKKWIVFDGPVDALWIENMNTVLDDNKKLCLPSNDILPLTDQMTMMFEVEDLSQASPATVSRCGMVYLEWEQLGWMPLIESFINQIPEILNEFKDYIRKLLIFFIDPSLSFIELHGKYGMEVPLLSLVSSCFRILKIYLNSYNDYKKLPK